MAKLNIFIDGSWLYKTEGNDSVLAERTANPTGSARISFAKLDSVLLSHVMHYNPGVSSLGERYLSTSVFREPPDFDNWPAQFPQFQAKDIEHAKRNIYARNRFVQRALDAGYCEKAVFRPVIKPWILEKLMQKRYQEKQVDTTVVALLVRSAITAPSDFHCVITGDSDILPAIHVAYPQYTANVFIATTHPDELKAEHRQTAFSLSNFEFNVPPLYLQDHVAGLLDGPNVYTCAHCHKVFVRQQPIPLKARPCCAACHKKRT